jgi:hypothetical protein
MSAKENIGLGIITLAWGAVMILGLTIHVWTIVASYIAKGLIVAVFTFLMPGISEIYWFVKIGIELGFDSNYCVAIMAYLGLWGLVFLGAMIATD